MVFSDPLAKFSFIDLTFIKYAIHTVWYRLISPTHSMNCRILQLTKLHINQLLFDWNDLRSHWNKKKKKNQSTWWAVQIQPIRNTNKKTSTKAAKTKISQCNRIECLNPFFSYPSRRFQFFFYLTFYNEHLCMERFTFLFL